MTNNYWMIPTNELNKLRSKYYSIMEVTDILEDAWNDAYKEYNAICIVLDERWREENKPDFEKFFMEHIDGKSWEEIDPDDWDFYSDWHKDIYGFRPSNNWYKES